MKFKRKHSGILLLALILSMYSKVQAQDAFSPIKFISPENGVKSSSEMVIDLSNTKDFSTKIDLAGVDTFYHLINATDKFIQCNVRASWVDFKSLIDNSEKNDFVYISLANKMADLGLFDLANYAAQKTKDKDISQLSIDDMRTFYFPKRKLKFDEELFLAETYSNIIYNNQSSEATNELIKNQTLMSTSDYANYIAALGYYKSEFFTNAKKYINIATIQNPQNLNYQGLKAKILSESAENSEALKIVENLKKQNLNSYEYSRKIASLEQFILYKTQKNEALKNYHLGYYYYIENDNSKAIKTLQNALNQRKKQHNTKIYALMSEVYLKMNEFEKASDYAKKAYKFDKNATKAIITLGDLELRNKKFKEALTYYKKAASTDKKSYIPLVKEAQTYQALSNTKKAKELYTKILKAHSDCFEAYYNIALLEEDKKTIYLKKAVAIYPMFEDGWIELAKTELEKGNYELVRSYLNNAFYIDENDFRYYYYLGLLNKNTGDNPQAIYNLKRSLKLNPKNEAAKIELNSLLYPLGENSRQDNI